MFGTRKAHVYREKKSNVVRASHMFYYATVDRTWLLGRFARWSFETFWPTDRCSSVIAQSSLSDRMESRSHQFPLTFSLAPALPQILVLVPMEVVLAPVPHCLWLSRLVELLLLLGFAQCHLWGWKIVWSSPFRCLAVLFLRERRWTAVALVYPLDLVCSKWNTWLSRDSRWWSSSDVLEPRMISVPVICTLYQWHGCAKPRTTTGNSRSWSFR